MGFPPDDKIIDYQRTRAVVIGGEKPASNRFRSTPLARLPVPLPAEYLCGIDEQRYEFEKGYYSYLRGEWRDHGWWYYYLIGLGLKFPLPAWGLILLGLFLLVTRQPAASGADDLALWLPALVILGLVSSQTGFNHHLRYVLPLFPFVIVSTSRTASSLRSSRWWIRLVVPLLLLGNTVCILRIHPHHLSYFNELAGGPDNGHDYLVDSNIDFGQDLLFLKKWLDEHPEAHPLGLAYYNFVDPAIVGINDFYLPPPGNLGPYPGYYAVSINFVRGASLSIIDG